MPFKSHAQMRRFASLVEEGKMDQSTFDEWKDATDFSELPDRIGPEKKAATDKVPPGWNRFQQKT